VTYSNYTATEAIVLFRKSRDDEFKIIKHSINCDAFRSE
jgi:hypothetical protein